METYEYLNKIAVEDLWVPYKIGHEDLWIPYKIGLEDLWVILYNRA